MRNRAAWALILAVPLCAAAPAAAQASRDACIDAARALVRQQVRWDDRRDGDYRGDGLLRWSAADGTWGSCRVDSRGVVYEVRIESWGRGSWSGYPRPGDTRPGGGYPPGAGVGRGDFTEEFGFDRRGDDFTSLSARTLSACQLACRDDARCLAYTFSAREEKCWLKSRVNTAQISRDMVTGYRIADTGGGGAGWGNLTEEWDFDRRGNDFEDFRAASLEECKEACGDEARCRAYTFDSRSRTCYLKDRVNAPQRNAGMVTGYKQ